jgi:hypothetical protein
MVPLSVGQKMYAPSISGTIHLGLRSGAEDLHQAVRDQLVLPLLDLPDADLEPNPSAVRECSNGFCEDFSDVGSILSTDRRGRHRGRLRQIIPKDLRQMLFRIWRPSLPDH